MIADSIALALTERFLSGRATQGERLITEALAREFGVSRSPVRKAITLLVELRVVSRRPRGGYIFSSTTAKARSALGRLDRKSKSDPSAIIASDRLAGKIGDKFTESDLSRRYGLSRAQTAGAIDAMAQAAVIEPEPGQGWRFSSLLTNSRADLYGYRFRMAIEPAAIADPDFIFDADAFRDCRLEQEAVAREASGFSPLMLFDMGVRFHETLAGCCANPFFLDALRRLNRRRRFIVHKVLLEPDRARRQAIEHLRLLDLLDQGRMSDAVKLLRRHLDENSDSKRGSRSHVHF